MPGTLAARRPSAPRRAAIGLRKRTDTAAATVPGMRISTAAVAIDRTPQRVRQLVAEGRLPGTIRLGRKVLHVPAEAVFEYVRGQAHRPATPEAVSR